MLLKLCFRQLVLSICFSMGIMSQAQQVKGIVVDENGVPLPGASIVHLDDNIGVSTDFDGNFTIQASEGDTLEVSFVGYTTETIVIGADSNVNIQLTPDSELQEVVVTALGIERNTKALGYSVTQVGGEEVNIVKQTNAINALQGKIAGVQITGNSTGAKGSTRVIIRGNSSLNGNNQPLYVIDGITINNNNLGSASLWGGSDSGDGISALNPDEVESISVLKGGAAAALYGSRASNGVIVITTKSGVGAEGLNVELSSSIQFDDVRNDPLDPQKVYGQGVDFDAEGDVESTYANWGVRLGSIASSEQWDGENRPYVDTGNNLTKFYKTGETFINTLAVSSASEEGNYRVSFSNLRNSDIIPNSTLNRNSLGLNLNQNFRNLTASINVKYVHDDSVGSPRLSDAPGNANFGIRMLPANLDVNDMRGVNGDGTLEDGTEFRTNANTFSQNPWFAAYKYFNNSIKERFIGSAELRWDIKDYLYAKGRYGTDRFDYHRTSGTPYGTAYQPLGSMNERKLTQEQYDADLFVGTDNLKPIANLPLSVTAFAGVGKHSQKVQLVTANGSNFIIPFLYAVNNTQNQSAGYGFSEKKINSVYGSAEFGYKDAVYFTYTARNDWFSTLSLPSKESPNNDLYTSASLSVVLSDLVDLPDIFTFAKLRAGISQVAGGADSPYALSLNYGIYGQGHLGASLGNIRNSSIPNLNITPFQKNETEIGFDVRLLENRLSLDFTYYDNETDGDIVGVSASPTSGYSSALANLGIITNSGIEILLNYTAIDKDDLTWDFTLNYSNNVSEIVSTNDEGTNISLQEPRTRNLRVTHIVGEKFGALFGTSYVRDQGRIVHDIESDGTPLPKVGERKILGFGVAPTSIGITNSIRYKDFNLSFLIEGKSGGQIFSGTNARMKSNGAHKATIDSDGGRDNGFIVEGVDGDGTPFTRTITPQRIEDYWSRTYQIAEESIYDSDYLRFRQLSLGYNVPSEYLEGTFIRSVRLSLIGRNLFFLSNSVENVDPESGYNANTGSQGLEYFGLPVPRSIGLNVNLNF